MGEVESVSSPGDVTGDVLRSPSVESVASVVVVVDSGAGGWSIGGWSIGGRVAGWQATATTRRTTGPTSLVMRCMGKDLLWLSRRLS